MSSTSAAAVSEASPAIAPAQGFVVSVVGAVAFSHLLNDLIQSVLPSVYPMLKTQFSLNFTQIGWISLVYQLTASLLQPWVGLYMDKHPKPYLLPAGMGVTLIGMGLLSIAHTYPMLLCAASVVGVGSSTFHPEASRVARMASGGRFGTAQSSFQVGGNSGSAIGPLMAAAIIVPRGQGAIAWVMLFALLAIGVLVGVTRWRVRHVKAQAVGAAKENHPSLSRGEILRAIVVIATLMFAKFVYISAFTNYFTFYLIQRFGVSVQKAQIYLFIFLAAIAVGTFVGGPVGDRIGRKAVIWVSFLGVAPFALMLPHADLLWTAVLAIVVGLVMSSAFAALVVYAQEAVPGRVGMIAGIMFGLMFGIGGLGAAGLGHLADIHGIVWVYNLCAFLPLLGLATAFLPDTRAHRYKR